ncbi:MAG: DMT family transporter [Bacteriovoracaceae bacterium]|nr:DMT family transporter [Bacteriovoracaceae bacterium]
MKAYGISPKHLALLLLTTASWGMSYVATKWLIADFSPLWMMGIRFFISSLLSIPLLFIGKQETSKKLTRLPMLCGFFLFLAIYLQILGLQYTTVAKSSFITTLFAFFTPLIMMFKDQVKIRIDFWLLLLTSLFGIFLMCELSFSGFNFGDFLTLICAIFCAFQIYYVGTATPANGSAMLFNLYQNLTIAILALTSAIIFETTPDWSVLTSEKSEMILLAFFVLIIFCTVIGFGLQVYTQQVIPAHLAGIFYLMESPFAALFGFVMLNETLTPQGMLGATIVTACVGLVPYTEKLTSKVKNYF